MIQPVDYISILIHSRFLLLEMYYFGQYYADYSNEKLKIFCIIESTKLWIFFFFLRALRTILHFKNKNPQFMMSN